MGGSGGIPPCSFRNQIKMTRERMPDKTPIILAVRTRRIVVLWN